MIQSWPVFQALFGAQARQREQQNDHQSLLNEIEASTAMSRRQAFGLAGATAAVAVVGKHAPVMTYPVSTAGASTPVVEYTPRTFSASA
jgi:hypothetical protein